VENQHNQMSDRRSGKSWGLSEPPRQTGAGTRRPSCPPGHRRVRPDGSDYCPSAGPNRNADMVASLRPGRDVVIAAWDGISRGVEVVHVGVAEGESSVKLLPALGNDGQEADDEVVPR